MPMRTHTAKTGRKPDANRVPGNRVAELRMQHKPILSQPALAFAAGVSPSYVYLVEAGRVSPSLDMCRKIATALGVSVDVAFPPAGKKRAAAK